VPPRACCFPRVNRGRQFLELEPKVYDEVKILGLQLRQEIDVPQEDFYLRTGIYDRGSARAGTLGIPLGTSTQTAEPTK
jgi:hypothetical protein